MCDIQKVKREIEADLKNGECTDELVQLIQHYEKMVTMDLNLMVYWHQYYMNAGLLDAALDCALLGKRFFPVSSIVYYNLASVYEQRGDLLLAAEYYEKAEKVCVVTNNGSGLDVSMIKEKIEKIWDTELNLLSDDQGKLEEVKKAVEYQKSLSFVAAAMPYVNSDKVIGDYLYFGRNEKRYVALYERKPDFYIQKDNLGDLVHSKAEMLEAEEGKEMFYQGAGAYLIPIAVAEPDTQHYILSNSDNYIIRQMEPLHFNYYRVENDTKITSAKTCYYGKAIPLGHSSERKKLVLNIFVDGLSQEILDGSDFNDVMPNTFRYFRHGTVCSQAYSAAEWTFPSLSSYVTGLDTLHHMMIHNQLCTELPEDVPTLAEYFREQGYLTTKIDGDWRSIPPYGHLRGYQRYIYHNQYWGSKGETMIHDVIEQIEAFKETDHFLWMCLGDLHDIADGYDLPIAVQSKLPLGSRTSEEKGSTSVKQAASENKIYQYKQMVSYTDMLLNRLYLYLEQNYSDEEIVVSLFGDHGQGYLIPEGEHFISKERVKVAFMFRGGAEGCPGKFSDELVSAVDYVPIMCKLAGIVQGDIEIQGNLPQCFGGKERRDYVISECLHPGDAYQVTFFADDHTVYFQNGVPTGEDGRFILQDETIEAVDLKGRAVNDKDLLESFYHLAVKRIAHLLIH